MVRTPSYDKNGIKKGAWSPEEDAKLQGYIMRYGHWNWRELPKFAGLKRCGKSCRLRWMNYLRPNLKHGNYKKEEEDLILELHEKHGNKWAMIASKLPGRTDNEIKNHWHTHLKKRVKPHRSTTTTTNKSQKPLSEINEPETRQKNLSGDPASSISHDIQILESCPIIPPEISSTATSEFSTSPVSSFEISTSSIEDGALEEIINSSEIFAEFTSLSHLEDQVTTYPNSMAYNEESVQENTSMMDIYGELEAEGLWDKSLSDTNEVLLSPYATYYDENFLQHFFDDVMHDLP